MAGYKVKEFAKVSHRGKSIVLDIYATKFMRDYLSAATHINKFKPVLE
jgi:hypothetical protein